jgi:hypothetical protein
MRWAIVALRNTADWLRKVWKREPHIDDPELARVRAEQREIRARLKALGVYVDSWGDRE